MTINEKLIKFIDNATPEELLRRWRFDEDGLMFQGKIGKRYADAMRKARSEMGDNAWAKLSKKIGWVK